LELGAWFKNKIGGKFIITGGFDDETVPSNIVLGYDVMAGITRRGGARKFDIGSRV
jgi:hypothetical protein